MSSRTARPALVLASRSPRRRLLLEALGFDVDVRPSGIDEIRREGEAFAQFAMRAAVEKAQAVRGSLRGDARELPIVAADTIVVLGNQLFGKPRDRDDASRMLTELAG